jgi:dihydroxyacid dehydratase/phosphogluconate dehydratase
MAAGRIDIPCIFITGGVMEAGPDLLTLEQIGKYSAMYLRGEISKEQFEYYKHHACPSCGACSFMGTASTMQIIAEALGLMLPGSSLMPATCDDLKEVAYKAGQQVVKLAQMDLTPKKIVTMKSFENAIMVHAAISGSTNSLLHIPAIAKEFGIELDARKFDELHRNAHYLLDIRPAGKWPAEYFYYAGGVPAVMEEINKLTAGLVNCETLKLTVAGNNARKMIDALAPKLAAMLEECDALENALVNDDPAPIIEAMNNMRKEADSLELLVDDRLWPLPKYRELLFIY